MSLYGRTDSAANVTKAGRGIAASSQSKTIVFVDETEAALESNKNRGINAPGWWSYYTYTDSSGATRHKAEHLVTLANADLNANETQSDDAIAADVQNIVTISAQPADASVTAPATGTFSVTASVTSGSGTIAYQWQLSTDSGTSFSDISGANSASYTTPATTAGTLDEDGYQYRVKLTTNTGAAEVVSTAATLTVA
tara:strand:+ start:226 stop:816 length:591 start_codon:yes stop_codon:yes gene_type:complete